MSLNPGSRSQILFSIEAFTSQIHSKSSSHQEFFQVEEQRAGSQFNKCACLDNSCWSGSFSFFSSCCSVAMSHSVCAHARIMDKPSLLKAVALCSAATQSQEHTGTHCTCSVSCTAQRDAPTQPWTRQLGWQMCNHTLPTYLKFSQLFHWRELCFTSFQHSISSFHLE